MTFGKRLTQLREEKGYNTRKKFAEKLSLPETTLRNYETDAREPGHTFLKQMSDFFNVSTDYLLGLTEEREKISPHQLKTSEMEHIKKYRALDPHGKEMVDFILQKEWERSTAASPEQKPTKEIHSSNTRLINYYYRLASAGTGQIVFDAPPTRRIEIPDISKYRKADYAIGVNGKSMEPTFYDGDMLLIEMTEEIEPGEIGIFLVNNESFVKKLGDGELISLNPDYYNIPLNDSSRCLGRVIDKI